MSYSGGIGMVSVVVSVVAVVVVGASYGLLCDAIPFSCRMLELTSRSSRPSWRRNSANWFK